MSEGRNKEKIYTSWSERYEQAKTEKPLLAKLTDTIQYKSFYKGQALEQFEELADREKFRFLQLCKKDVALNKTQAETIAEVLSKTIVEKKVRVDVGDSLVEKHPDLLLVAATYVNSL